jgi:hypothetical protein
MEVIEGKIPVLPRPWSREYQRMMVEARLLYEDQVLGELAQVLANEYTRMLDDIIQDVRHPYTTPGRMAGLRESILRRLGEFRDAYGVHLDAAVIEAIEVAVDGHRLATEAASRAAGVTINASWTKIPAEAVDLLALRRPFMGSYQFTSLVDRGISEMGPRIDRLLASQFARGVNAVDRAKQIADVLGAYNPSVRNLLRNGTVRIDRFTREILNASTEGIDEELVKQARKLIYDSYRIAVTETNSAFFAADQHAASESPVVSLVKWEVSGRHWGLPSSPDICSAYHLRDWTGYGPGVWHPASVPIQPHPFCGCSTSKILRRPSEWSKPKPPLTEPRMTDSDEMRRVLEQARGRVRGTTPRPITDRFVETQTELSNRLASQSYDVAREVSV